MATNNTALPWQIFPLTTAIIEDDYILDHIIGRGTFGVVRKGIHRITGQLTAVKIVAKTKLSTLNDVEDLKQEVEIMQSLPKHGNIVELLNVYEDKEFLYLVMEFCKGGDLLDFLNSPSLAAVGGFSEVEAAEIFYQVAEAVAHCTENGIMHRDLKPENILFVEPFVFNGQCRKGPRHNGALYGRNKQQQHAANLSNQSLIITQLKAKVQSEDKSDAERITAVLQNSETLVREEDLECEHINNYAETEGGRSFGVRETRKPARVKLGDWGLAVKVREGELFDGMAGSDPYLCPEMILEELYGIEADIWSLGVLLFILLSRKLPFSVTGDGQEVGDSCQKMNYGVSGNIDGELKENSDKSQIKSVKGELFHNICEGRLDFDSAPWISISDEAKDLVSKMLSVDKCRRPKAHEILKHPWMQQARAVICTNFGSPVTREPGIIPLAELRRRSCDNLPGLAFLTSNHLWLNKRAGLGGARESHTLSTPSTVVTNTEFLSTTHAGGEVSKNSETIIDEVINKPIEEPTAEIHSLKDLGTPEIRLSSLSVPFPCLPVNQLVHYEEDKFKSGGLPETSKALRASVRASIFSEPVGPSGSSDSSKSSTVDFGLSNYSKTSRVPVSSGGFKSSNCFEPSPVPFRSSNSLVSANGYSGLDSSGSFLATCRGHSPTSNLKDLSTSRLGSTLRLHDFSLNYRPTLQA